MQSSPRPRPLVRGGTRRLAFDAAAASHTARTVHKVRLLRFTKLVQQARCRLCLELLILLIFEAVPVAMFLLSVGATSTLAVEYARNVSVLEARHVAAATAGVLRHHRALSVPRWSLSSYDAQVRSCPRVLCHVLAQLALRVARLFSHTSNVPLCLAAPNAHPTRPGRRPTS